MASQTQIWLVVAHCGHLTRVHSAHTDEGNANDLAQELEELFEPDWTYTVTEVTLHDYPVHIS